MIGGFRFALARAKAALPPLVTLAVIAAIAAALLAGVAGSIRAAEAQEVRAALAATPGDLGRLVIDVRGDASPDEVATTVENLVMDAGAPASILIEVDGDAVVVSPDLTRISGADLAPLLDVLTGFGSAIERASGASVQVAGSLERTLSGIADSVETRRGPTTVALALLGVLSAVVVAAVAVETVRGRRDENHLLRARGARRRSLFWAAGVESFVVALVGAAVGAVVGALGASLIGGAAADPVLTGAAALAVALVAAGVAAIATVRGIDRRASRAQAVADIGIALVLAIATGAAAWRFAQEGTPVIRRGGGTTTLDPLVAIAPALILGLAALVAVAIATPIARGVAAALAGSRGVVPVTPLRLASRRPGRHALSIVVVAFAIGAIGIAGAYQGSLTALGDAPEELRVGADVRVGTIPDDVDTNEIASLQPSTAAMPARPMSGRTADGRVPILAADASQLGAVMRDAGGTIDPAALGETLSLDEPGVPLAGDTLTLTVIAPAPAPVVVDGEEFIGESTPAYGRVTVIGSGGATSALPFTNFDLNETVDNDITRTELTVRAEDRISLELPTGGPWRLGGIDIASYAYWGEQPEVIVAAVESGGEQIDLGGFRAVTGTPGAVAASAAGLVFEPLVEGGGPWTQAVGPGIPYPVPAVVTRAVAESMSLVTDERFSLEIVSPDVAMDFFVAGVIDVLPGTATGEGVLVDMTTLGLASPVDIVPTQVWMASAQPAQLAVAVAEAFPQTVTVIANPLAARNAAATATGFVLAASGAVGLAIAVLVLRRTRSRADSRELALVAVLGLGRARAARLRAREDLFAVAIGVVGGLAAGAATAWFVVPPLVRAASGSIPPAFPVPLHAQPIALTAAFVLAAAVFGLIVSTVRTPSRLAILLREDE